MTDRPHTHKFVFSHVRVDMRHGRYIAMIYATILELTTRHRQTTICDRGRGSQVCLAYKSRQGRRGSDADFFSRLIHKQIVLFSCLEQVHCLLWPSNSTKWHLHPLFRTYSRNLPSLDSGGTCAGREASDGRSA
jgi:hypothetical protein